MSWWDDAACKGLTPLFFCLPSASNDDTDVIAAKAICATCTVRAECLAEVLTMTKTDDAYEIRGGLTPDERYRLPRTPKPSAGREPDCGTDRGYNRHRYLGQQPCAACTADHLRVWHEKKATASRAVPNAHRSHKHPELNA